MLKNVLGRVAAFWALLVFTSTLFVFAIPIGAAGFWPEPKRSRIAYYFNTAWMGLFFILIGVRRTIKGRAYFEKGKNYVVVCNHRSLMDPPLSSPAMPGPNRTIAKAEMARIPIFGIPYKRGSILVDRKSEESRRASYGKMKEVLAMGLHMCIYPEGTRNKGREPVQPFHDGAFRLAVDAQKDLIPAVLFNTDVVMPRQPSFYFWPRRVQLHFLPPIAVAGHTVESLKQQAYEVINSYYTANAERLGK